MRYLQWLLGIGVAFLMVMGSGLAEEEEYPYVGEVTALQLVVRGGPSTNFKEVGLLRKGDKVLVFEKKGDFLRIRYPKDARCWVNKKYVATEDGITGTVTGDRLTVRESPDFRGSPLHGGILTKGTKVRIIRSAADWYQIAPPKGLCAWVGSKYIIRLGSWEELHAKYPELGDREITDVEREPSTLEEKPGEVVIPKEKYQEIFDEADTLFQQEIRKSPEEQDYSKILEKFKEVELNTKDERLKERARSRVDTITPIQSLLTAYRMRAAEGERIREEYEAKIRALQEEFFAAREKEKKPPQYAAMGYVDGVGFLLNVPSDIRYKLVMGGKVLYFLKSPAVNLKKYYNKYVGIVGSIVEGKEGMPYKIIEVERVDVLGEPE